MFLLLACSDALWHPIVAGHSQLQGADACSVDGLGSGRMCLLCLVHTALWSTRTA